MCGFQMGLGLLGLSEERRLPLSCVCVFSREGVVWWVSPLSSLSVKNAPHTRKLSNFRRHVPYGHDLEGRRRLLLRRVAFNADRFACAVQLAHALSFSSHSRQLVVRLPRRSLVDTHTCDVTALLLGLSMAPDATPPELTVVVRGIADVSTLAQRMGELKTMTRHAMSSGVVSATLAEVVAVVTAVS